MVKDHIISNGQKWKGQSMPNLILQVHEIKIGKVYVPGNQ